MNVLTLLKRTPTGYQVAGDFMDRDEVEKFVDAAKATDATVEFEAVNGPADMWSDFIGYDPEMPTVTDFTPDETIYFKAPDGSWRSAKFIAARADHELAVVSAAGPQVLPLAVVSRAPTAGELRYDDAAADDWGEPLENPNAAAIAAAAKSKSRSTKKSA